MLEGASAGPERSKPSQRGDYAENHDQKHPYGANSHIEGPDLEIEGNIAYEADCQEIVAIRVCPGRRILKKVKHVLLTAADFNDVYG